ncbi:uncharacterized protein K452DRAFT_286211 [Aplosporella prunicola CBS 121167]|uniref:GAT domain-containing protein n=1 Tax=Aplosporella prunicola CBS 121167 TaxID=1176127 RepID=A0A6A6BGV3_9PEZI|nr:uncharacterized protein K452DRAFT_286211 [Aplosporella prunicola CBS 121167]KAF2143382.1 hypothetical protein K452DRAFT_286211 [Aplosporella prunicola CBS 121167]
MVLKRFTGLLNRRSDDEPAADADTPEANATRGVKLFCESGGPNNSTEEIQYLPDIVTAAESSPPAAAACAYQIRKFLSKDNYSKPYLQYNAIMLIRILADNPGPTFTRNMNEKFVTVVKELLRQGKDPSVQQILRETLYSMERDKAYDTNLIPLFNMWRNEQVFTSYRKRGEGGSPSSRVLNAPPWNSNNPNQQGAPTLPAHPSRSRSLPSPEELAGRIEEAKTSAKLLIQLIQSTQQSELTSNELVQEFGERCQQAQRSIQGYINAENPAPDDDTMLTLIETNEQLSLAMSKHQRAMLGARRTASSNNVNEATDSAPTAPSGPLVDYATNSSSSTSPVAPASYAPSSDPPVHRQPSLANRESPPSTTANAGYDSGRQSSDSYFISDDPFADPNEPQNYGSHVTTQADLRNAYAAMGEETKGGVASPHPGYNSTPSYLARQESSGVNHTMHGAFSPVEEGTGTNFSGVSALGPEEHERGTTYNSGAGMDVSPVEERRVVYRY